MSVCGVTAMGCGATVAVLGWWGSFWGHRGLFGLLLSAEGFGGRKKGEEARRNPKDSRAGAPPPQNSTK